MFTLGAISSVIPKSHPRGIVGIVADAILHVPDAQNPTDAPTTVSVAVEDCQVQAGSRLEECESLIEDFMLGRQMFASSGVRSQVRVSAAAVGSSLVTSLQGTRFRVTDFHFEGALDYYLSDEKPSGYVVASEDTFYLIQGDGVILTGAISSLPGQYKSAWATVPSNLRQALPSEIGDAGWFSVKGAIVSENYLYVSSSWRGSSTESCWTTALFRASIHEKPLDFQEIFSPDDCGESAVDGEDFNGHQSGGGLAKLDDGRIVLAIGDYRKWTRSQDPTSFMGKVVLIDPETSSVKVIAKGLRNPQGVLFDSNRNGLWITDQGPRGGDEVNFLSLEDNQLVNFGWPISSYGEHYGQTSIPEAPLHRSHSDYGFEEPRWHWTTSSPVASITISPDKLPGDFVVGVLGHGDASAQQRAIQFFSSADYGNSLEIADILVLGERVRSIEAAGENALLATFDSGSLALIEVEGN